MKQVFLLINLVFYATMAWSQTVEGLIQTETGYPLMGALIQEFGTENTAETDIFGYFQIKTSAESSIRISIEGYESKWTIVADSLMEISLKENPLADDVVYTALNYESSPKELTFAVSEMSGKTLTQVSHLHPLLGMAGRVPGMQIERNANALGGAPRVRLRGNRSVTDNQVLYVIDGVPLFNFVSASPTTIFGDGMSPNSIGRDGGDAFSGLNPEDIDAISILHGPSATVLYGSQGANGAILIRTKKGKKGAMHVRYSSQFLMEEVMDTPNLQYTYGQSEEGGIENWGSQESYKNPTDDFYQRGMNWKNAIQLSSGTGRSQTRFSYAHTIASGVIPTSTVERHNFNLRETVSLFKNRLTVNTSLYFNHQKGENRPTSGYNGNVLPGLFLFPRGEDFTSYMTDYEEASSSNPYKTQRWVTSNTTFQNPGWVLHRNVNTDERNRYFGMVSGKLSLGHGIYLRGRGQLDKTYDNFEQKFYASSSAVLANPNGRYVLHQLEASQRYGDAMAEVHRKFGQIRAVGYGGVSVHDQRMYSELHDSHGANFGMGLSSPNRFNLQSIDQSALQANSKNQLFAGFAKVKFGYKDLLFLDLGGRSDWTTTLSKAWDYAMFYPSAGVSAVVSDLVRYRLPYLKVRASFGQAGNGLFPYQSTFLHQNRGVVQQYPGTRSEVERTASTEFGVETRFWKKRGFADITLYQTVSKNQQLMVPGEEGTNVAHYILPTGSIQNRGLEALLSLDLIQRKNVVWNVQSNFFLNRNTVLELDDRLDSDRYNIQNTNGYGYGMAIEEGGSLGDIVGTTFLRNDWGHILVDGNNRPMKGSTEILGNANPDWMAGLENTLSISNIQFKFLLDGRFGGEVMSLTQAVLDQYGASEATQIDRDQGLVEINGLSFNGQPVSATDVPSFYKTVGGLDGISEYYVYDATNVRVREASIGLHFPIKPMRRMKGIQGLTIEAVGYNLLFLMKKVPFDPEITMSSGNRLQGVDVFSLPSTRSYGLKIGVKF